MTTSAPARASASASARPRPREPPVTRATRPERSISIAMVRSLRPVHRIGVEERRARLVRRHRLAPTERASDPLAVARGRLVCLHATDAVTVFLSIQARSNGVAPTDVERALYEERSLVRMLAMRRTLWCVPRELVPVVFAAATRAVAATQRKRLEGFVRDSGVSTRPAPGSRAPGTRPSPRWPRRRGDARGRRRRAAAGEEAPLRLGPLGHRAERGRASCPSSRWRGGLVRGRPRGTWISPQFRWVTTEDWLGGPIEEVDVARPRRAAAPLARRLRPRDRDRHAALVDGLDGARDPGRARGDPARRGRPRRRDRLRARRRPRADEPAEPSAALPTLDPTTMGWKEREWYLGLHGTTLFDSNGNAGPTSGGRTDRRRLEPAPRRRDRARPARGRRPRRPHGDRRRGRPPARLGRRRPLLPGFLPPSSEADGLSARLQLRADQISSRGRKISFAITSRWICEVPS